MKLSQPAAVFTAVLVLAGGAAVAVNAVTTTDPVTLCSNTRSGAVSLPSSAGACPKGTNLFHVASDSDVQALATRLDSAEATLASLDPNAKATDSELLDGQDSTAFAASSHDHDARYYTKTQAQGRTAPNSLSCPAGEFLRSVAADGTPTCGADANDQNRVVGISGAIPRMVAAQNFGFAGPTASITLEEGETMVATFSGVVGSTETPVGIVEWVPCHAAAGQQPTAFSRWNLRAYLRNSVEQILSTTQAIVLPAGTYQVGLCVRSTVTLDDNHFVTGTITVDE